MEIIKHGDPERLKEVRYFKCDRCGCEFTGDNNEYTVRQVDYDGTTVCVMTCPECGNEDIEGK